MIVVVVVEVLIKRSNDENFTLELLDIFWADSKSAINQNKD